MASPKIAIILMSLALFAAAASAHTTTNKSPFCSNVEEHTALCNKLAGGAHTWAEAMTKVLGSFRTNVVAGKHVAYGVEAKMPATIRHKTKQSLGAVCRDVYDSLVYSIDSCIGFVKTDPSKALETFLSTSTLTACTDAVHDSGVSLPEVDKFDREVQKFSSLLLAMAQSKH